MKILKFFSNRITVTVSFILLELLWVVLLLERLTPYIAPIETAVRLFGVLIVFSIINLSRHLSSDMMWIVLIVSFPIPGTLLYIFLSGLGMMNTKTWKGIRQETEKAQNYYVQDASTLQKAIQDTESLCGQPEYISKHAGFPVYINTGYEYYPLGEIGYLSMLNALETAEEFIFLEYFIIEEGLMWNSILEILKGKAASGLDVRVLYDDMGSIHTLSTGYAKELETYGIKAMAFNRINPLINGIMNHRDHRKILVIDGKTAFTGGINLADEYINKIKKYGHWKDNCVKIQGEAVWSFTVMFLTTWNALRHEDSDYTVYKREPLPGKEDGYVAPYGENPLDDQHVGQDIYINILNQARDYVYIFTPYLIIDSDMMNALILAAERGVDVRIITPGVPDKKLIYAITRSYYRNLLRGGVRIYEYTPGFDHAKVFVSDDCVATVGTLNLDYRSLYLHFENGTWLYGAKAVKDIREDVLLTLEKCHEVSAKDREYGVIKTFFISIIRLFAPLM